MAEYQEVPVSAAAFVAHEFAKDIVVIVAFDEPHNRLHFTSYGSTAAAKEIAARMCDRIANECGVDVASIHTFADFRHRTEAEWAREKERLQQELEMTADKLSNVWLHLDSWARGEAPSLEFIRDAAASILRRQECPGWKSKERDEELIN